MQLNTDKSTSAKFWKTVHDLKIFILAGGLLFCSLALFVVSDYVKAEKQSFPLWVLYIPFHSLADACFVAAMVGFGYEWFVRSESEGHLRELMGELFRALRSDISKDVKESLLTDPHLLCKWAGPAERERIMQSALQAELGDDQLGQEIYESSVKRALSYKERWLNYRCIATLVNIGDETVPVEVRGSFFHCYYDIRYSTRLESRCLKFLCVSTIKDYNEWLADTNCEMVWLFPSLTAGSDLMAESGFAVSNVIVGGLPLSLDTKSSDLGLTYFEANHADLGSLIGNEVTVQYRVDVRVKKTGHLLTLNFVYPTKGISMEIDVTNTDIAEIAARDFFSSSKKPVIRYLPSSSNTRKITVEIEGWVFPKGGVDFIWTLKSEIAK